MIATLTCDRCGRLESIHNMQTEEAVFRIARRAGWQALDDGQHVCPACWSYSEPDKHVKTTGGASMHSPVPFRFTKDDVRRLVDANGVSIMCDEFRHPWCPDKDEDWDFIARACSTHYQLLEIVKNVRNYLTAISAEVQVEYAILQAVIAQAEGPRGSGARIEAVLTEESDGAA